jgi:hypothetical protein
MTGPLHRADVPMPTPRPLTGPATGPTAWPPAAPEMTVPDLLCGHLPGEGCDDECAYWRMVATGELPGPDAYLVDGVHILPPAAPGLAPLTDPALRGWAA